MRALLTRRAVIGLVIIGVFVLLAIFGPLLSPHDPSESTAAVMQGRSGGHLLGTTELGQDVLSQLLTGTRSSIVTAVLAAVIATFLSVVVGVSSGYLAGAGGELLSAFSNVFLVIPALPLVIVLSGYLHGGGTIQVAVVISVTGWALVPGAQGADIVPATAGLRIGGARRGGASVPDHNSRDTPSRAPDRGIGFLAYRHLRHNHASELGLLRPGEHLPVELGHDAVLDPKRAGVHRGGLVVVSSHRASVSRCWGWALPY